jgi:methylglyoxal reductase
MQKRNIGSSGIEASVVGLGTWGIGGGPWWGETNDADSVRTIHAAIDSGVNLIDTAPLYGFGHSEKVVGTAIKGRRQDVVLSTKCGLWWDDDQGSFFFEMDGYQVKRCLRPDTIGRELEASLKRLGTDYIDLYHTHWQAIEPDKTPIAETMEYLGKLKEKGIIRSIGVSNVDLAQLDEYLAAGIIDANQAPYSMLNRAIEPEIAPFCAENNISILAYMPLEQGLLTGKIGMDKQFGNDEWRNQIPWYLPVNRKRVLDMLDGWRDMASSYGCTMSQLVIAWTVQQKGISFALCGARHPEQIIENAKTGSLMLKKDDLLKIRQDVESLGEPVVPE